MTLTIGYFYQKELNLYGDTGNVEILVKRAKDRNIPVEVVNIGLSTTLNAELISKINLVFMGGGPDSGQKNMYEDLVANKKQFIKDFIESGKPALFICGAYQLMGKYYKSADGSELEGLSVFDMYTQHFGHGSKRCVGNMVCKLSEKLLADPIFTNVNHVGSTVVGFENHGGKTFLNDGAQHFAQVVSGYGNNAQDKSEGMYYKCAIGTYFHGPLLSKNPHIADYLIAKALGVDTLTPLDDTMILKAHSALLGRS